MADHYDVVIVGGGITGAGIAQAAAAAGYSILVLEQTSIAAATSSRSSKLIHGGLRYLGSGQWPLVRESLREREILLRIAPNLVHRVAFYIPVYEHSHHNRWIIRAGLSLYALLGGLTTYTRFTALPRSAWNKLDGLKTDGLKAVFRYWDAQTDDAALTHAVMASAQILGAKLACPARFLQARRESSKVEIEYLHTDQKMRCSTDVLINAAGPWINSVLQTITPSQPPLNIDLVQGTHIVVPGTMVQGIYYIEAPQDGRPVFVMPWQHQTLIGTTETQYTGKPLNPDPLVQEIDYLLEALRQYFPARGSNQPVASFAGLRVLPYATGLFSRRARDILLQTDDPARPRVLTVAGGKLTGYRATALRVLDQIRPLLPLRAIKADTAVLKL